MERKPKQAELELGEEINEGESKTDIETVNAEAPSPKRRQRKARAAAPPVGLSLNSAATSAIEDSEAAEDEEPASKPTPRKRSPRPRTPKLEKKADLPEVNLAPETPKEIEKGEPPIELTAAESTEDLSLACASIDKSMDSMVKQWGAVKDISTSVSSNLEKVTKLLTEQSSALEVLARPVAKPSHLTRLAIGISAFALILSFVSLALSQSARQEALAKEIAKTAPVAAAATPTTPEIALGAMASAKARPTPRLQGGGGSTEVALKRVQNMRRPNHQKTGRKRLPIDYN